MNKVITIGRNLLNDESGQELIEYALIAALVGVASVTILGSLQSGISTAYQSVINKLTGVN